METKKENSLSKFKVLKNYVINNAFITKNKSSIFIDKFCEAQKCYFGFLKLAYLFKIKSSKIFSMNTDLYMSTSLSDLKQSQVLTLYDIISNTTYKFRLSDLINIINNNLSNAPDFFVEPKPICNPYTNIPFSKSQLYTIYFKIKESTFIMPLLFELFYCNNFDIEDFARRNECIIRDHAIKSYLKGATIEQKYRDIVKMLRSYNYIIDGIIIDPEFPKKTLVRVFNSYLEYYLIVKYSLSPTLRFFSKEKLKEKLVNFRKLNPTFGRRIIKNISRQQGIILNASPPAPEENQIIPYNHIGQNGGFVFRATPDNLQEWTRQRRSTISFIETVINEESQNQSYRMRRDLSHFPRSRATRRRTARLTILPAYNNLIEPDNYSSDEIEMELEPDNSPPRLTNTVISNILSVLDNE